MARTIRHWTPHYVVNRLVWAVQERLHPQEPWLTRQACDFIGRWLKPEHHGIEWGSGRSTLWLASHMGRLISIEHDSVWYQQIQDRLKTDQIKNVDYRFASTTQTTGAGIIRYEDVALELQDATLDFALVDGQLRDLCVGNVLGKLKPGGLLVLDNAEQFISHPSYSPSSLSQKGAKMTDRWQALTQQLSTWNCTWTSNGVFDTAMFIKPSAC